MQHQLIPIKPGDDATSVPTTTPHHLCLARAENRAGRYTTAFSTSLAQQHPLQPQLFPQRRSMQHKHTTKCKNDYGNKGLNQPVEPLFTSSASKTPH